MYTTRKPKEEKPMVIEAPKERNHDLHVARHCRKAGRITEKRAARGEQRRYDLQLS